MKLLMLSQYYDPEPFPFPHQTAKRMREKGHQVKVLTGFPGYPRGCIYPGYRQSLLKREAIDGVEVIRLPLLPDHSLSSARRTLYYVSLAASATVIAPFVSGNPDLVFSSPASTRHSGMDHRLDPSEYTSSIIFRTYSLNP